MYIFYTLIDNSMNKITSLFCLFLCLLFMISAKAQNQKMETNWNVETVSVSDWDRQTGVPYVQVPGANLGATSFTLLDSNRLAFLSNSSNEVIIVDRLSGRSISRFVISFSPKDFVFANGSFYVLSDRNVVVFNEKGKELDRIDFPAKYTGVERIARYGKSTYLLLPNGNSLYIQTDGQSTNVVHEQEGWITSTGNFIAVKLNKGNGYFITVITPQGRRIEKTFFTDKKVAGVFVVGSSLSRLVVDVQTFISESPISIDRSITAISISDSTINGVILSKRNPTCYYVLSNKDLEISNDGTIYNMVTSTKGISVFSLTEIYSSKSKNYPADLLKVKYHFNDHLVSEH